MDDTALWDLLAYWANCRYPLLLSDPAALQNLHDVLHKVLVRCVVRERRRCLERMWEVSEN